MRRGTKLVSDVFTGSHPGGKSKHVMTAALSHAEGLTDKTEGCSYG